MVPGSGLPGDRGQQESLGTHVGHRRGVQEAPCWEEDSLHGAGAGGYLPQRVKGCVCSLGHVSQLTHLEWLPSLVWGRCGGGGTVLCASGRTRAKSAMGCMLGKRQDSPFQLSRPHGCTLLSAGPALLPSQNSRHLPLAAQDSITLSPALATACLPPPSPTPSPASMHPAQGLCDPGAVLPGLFRKLLNETRLTSWADVILWTREQVSMIWGFQLLP